MLKVNRKLTVLVILTLSFLFTTPVWSEEEWDVRLQKEIETNLVCQDDCGMIVSACDNNTAEYMRGIIKEKLAEGYTKQQVLDHFVEIYGERVLAAPPVSGFNITAWVTPFIVIIAGGLVVFFVLDKWAFNKNEEDKDAPADKPKIDLSEYEEKLDDELKKYL